MTKLKLQLSNLKLMKQETSSESICFAGKSNPAQLTEKNKKEERKKRNRKKKRKEKKIMFKCYAYFQTIIIFYQYPKHYYGKGNITCIIKKRNIT